jgi:hypothetical protein
MNKVGAKLAFPLPTSINSCLAYAEEFRFVLTAAFCCALVAPDIAHRVIAGGAD